MKYTRANVRAEALTVQLHLDCFKILATKFCPRYGPMRAAFQTFHGFNTQALKARFSSEHPQEKSSICPTAVHNHLKAASGLGALSLDFSPLETPHLIRSALNQSHQFTQATDPYFTTQFGRSVGYYDASKIETSGYLVQQSVRALSNALLNSSPHTHPYFPIHRQQAIIFMASFLGLGLTFDTESSQGQGVDPILASAIFLGVKGQNAKRLTVQYGLDLRPHTLAKLLRAFETLAPYSDQIYAIRNLALGQDSHSEQAS